MTKLRLEPIGFIGQQKTMSPNSHIKIGPDAFVGFTENGMTILQKHPDGESSLITLSYDETLKLGRQIEANKKRSNRWIINPFGWFL